MTNRKGSWAQTFTGKQFWPLDPRAEEVDIEDIANALAKQCRFNGNCNKFYSVAEHSVFVSQECDPEHALEGLLHDASEAYIGDMVKPLKIHVPQFREIEERIERCVALHFGLKFPWPKDVMRADVSVLAAEKRDIMGPAPASWGLEGIEPMSRPISAFAPPQALAMFMERYHALTS